MATTPSRAEEKARKVRSLLASYYAVEDDTGNGSQAKSRQDQSGASTPSSPDPAASLSRLLRTARLADLMAQSGSVAAEVATLDSDMQMLVYENYNKFIIATDTMRAMAGSLDGMDAKLTHLQALLGNVMERSSDVSGRLDSRQRQIEELSATRLLLRRLQAVFELPKKIRAAMDTGRLEVAVDACADVLPLLRAHGQKGALRRVAGEIDALAGEVLERVRGRLAADPGDVSDCIRAMARLGRPPAELQTAFLVCKRGVLQDTLEAADAVLSSQALAAGLGGGGAVGEEDLGRAGTRAVGGGVTAPLPAAPPALAGWYAEGTVPSLKAFLVGLDSRFLTELAATCAEFWALFENCSDPGPLHKMLRSTFSRYLALTRRALSDATALVAAAGAGISTSGYLLVPAADLLSDPRGPEAAAAAALGGARWGVGEMVGGLYVVKNDVARLESVARDLAPRDRASELTEHTVRQHLGLTFAALECRAAAVLGGTRDALAEAGGHPQRRAVLTAAAQLLRHLIPSDLSRLLASLQEYQQHDWVLAGWRDVFLDMLAGRLRHCVASLGREMAALCHAASAPEASGQRSRSPSPTRALRLVSTVDGGGAPFAAPRRGAGAATGDGRPAPHALAVLLARVCADLAGRGMDGVTRQLAVLTGTAGSGGALPPRVARDFARELGGAQTRLLEAYTEAHAARLELAARSMMEAGAWKAGREPRGPRELCVLLLDTLAEITGEVEAVAEPGGPALPSSAASSVSLHRATPSGGSSTPLPPEAEALGAAVSRMFAVRDPATDDPVSAPAVCAGVAFRALRAMAGALAGASLARPDFQQVQLDVHFLRAPVQAAVVGSADEPVVLQALDEVLAAAMERCAEPVLLETAVLDRILASRVG